MSLLDKKSQVFKLSIITLTILLFCISFMHFYRTYSYPTDENFYVNPPSRFYVYQPIPAQIMKFDTKTMKSGWVKDTIRASSLILKINDTLPKNIDNFWDMIESSGNKIKIEFIETSSPMRPSISQNDVSSNLYPVNGAIVKAIVDKENFSSDNIKYLNSAVLVIEVGKGGVSDRAGIKIGDIITKINGNTFSNAIDADHYLRKSKTGVIFSYNILRGNEEKTVNLEVVKFGVSVTFLIIFILGLLYIICGMTLLLNRPYLKSARLLGLLLILVGFTLSQPNLTHRLYLEVNLFTIIRNILIISAILLIPPLYIHTKMYFPIERKEIKSKKYLIWIPYIVTILAGLLIVLSQTVLSARLLNYAYIALEGELGFCLLYYFIILLIFRKKLNPEYKKYNKILKWTFILLFLDIIVINFINIYFPSNASDMIIGIMMYILLMIGIISIPAAIFITISKYHLLEMDLRIRRNIQYYVFTSIWKIAVVIGIIAILWGVSEITFRLPNIHFTGFSLEILNKPLRSASHIQYEKFLLAVIAMISVLIFLRIQKWVQNKIDNKFYQGSFDYRRATTEFSGILARNITMSGLAASIVEELGELVRLKRVGILVFKDDNNLYVQDYFNFNSQSFRDFCKATVGKLTDVIRKYSSEIRVETLPEPINEIFKKCEFKYIIPICSKTRLVGALLIGEKLSEAAYRKQDLEFLISIAGQTSVSIENSLLYEDLAIQERLKHELEIARRIQLASLPDSIPNIKGLDISGISLPALEVGGDFYDFLNGEENELTVVVGDVSGKGTSAALYMSKVQGILRTLHEFNFTPRKLFIRTNQLLYKYLEKSAFITVIGAKIDLKSRKISLARAGHLPMLFFHRAENRVEKIVPKGLVLGLNQDNLFNQNLEEMEIYFEPGDIFVFVTDGVIEARDDAHQEFGEERLIELIMRSSHISAESIRNLIMSSVKDYAGNMQQFDDQTVVVIKICDLEGVC